MGFARSEKVELDIEDYAEAKKEWLSQFLDLKNGIPSHDTFRRIFCILEFDEFQKFFIKWTSEIRKKLNIKNDENFLLILDLLKRINELKVDFEISF